MARHNDGWFRSDDSIIIQSFSLGLIKFFICGNMIFGAVVSVIAGIKQNAFFHKFIHKHTSMAFKIYLKYNTFL